MELLPLRTQLVLAGWCQRHLFVVLSASPISTDQVDVLAADRWLVRATAITAQQHTIGSAGR
jgi:hypothetical protein